MKKIKILLFSAITFTLLVGCKNDGRYVDLNTGKKIELEKDTKTNYMVDVETKKPVYLYIDTKTKDTLYGRTGEVVNGKVAKTSDERWKYDDNEFVYKDGDYKLKVDEDGYKIKEGDYKKVVENDGDVKIKDGSTKTKIDGETGEKKVKKD